MPDLDLGPDDYKIRDPKTGRFEVPDSPATGLVGFVIGVAMVIVTLVYAGEINRASSFALVALMAWAAAGGFANWQINSPGKRLIFIPDRPKLGALGFWLCVAIEAFWFFVGSEMPLYVYLGASVPVASAAGVYFYMWLRHTY